MGESRANNPNQCPARTSDQLTAREEEELLAAVAEIEGGDYVTLEQLLTSLPK